MIIVIDGYNLLKNWYSNSSFHDEKERYAFLHKIARYGKKKHHKMVVVFDGGLYEWPYKEKIAGITVLYSARESADEIIMQYLEDHKNKDILLVSSDHELNLFASHLNIISIGSTDFVPLITDALQREADQTEVTVTVDDEATELAVLMEQATEEIPYKDDDKPCNQEIITRAHPSRHDKRLLKKLKKL
jgi:predicted RNA-binding protein with PIN domain